MFIVLACGSIIGLSTRVVQEGPVKSFTATIAYAAGILLRLLDPTVAAAGTLVRSSRFQMEIVNACNGVYVTALLVSAILAAPAPWSKRLTGIIIGTALIYILNLLRAVSLFLIGSHLSYGVFEFFHVYVWQTLVVLLTVAFFLGWLGTVPSEGERGAEAGDGDDDKDAAPERGDNTALDPGGAPL